RTVVRSTDRRRPRERIYEWGDNGSQGVPAFLSDRPSATGTPSPRPSADEDAYAHAERPSDTSHPTSQGAGKSRSAPSASQSHKQEPAADRTSAGARTPA